MTDREKLLVLIDRIDGRCPAEGTCFECQYGDIPECSVHAKVDYLIESGVTFATDNHVGHWIPISEKLPDIDVKVIVYDAETGIMHTGAFDGMLWHLGDGGWLLDLDDFTHWMPLPEPPTPVKDGERDD